MSELKLVKSAQFGATTADIYSDGREMFMTIEQLASCLGYATRRGVELILERNSYLKDEEFSTTYNLCAIEGGRTVTRDRTVFTEDGIYEVTMLSKRPKAQEFRRFVRTLLKSLRSGELMLTNGTATAAPALTQSQIEKFFIPALESRLNYQSAWLAAQFDQKILELTKKIDGTITVTEDQYPRPVGHLLQGCPADMEWKQWVYRLLDCHIIMTGVKQSHRDILSMLYRYMLRNYGYVADEERKKYRRKHPSYDGRIATINLLDDDPKWREIFSNVLISFVSNKGNGFDSVENEAPAAKKCERPQAITKEEPARVIEFKPGENQNLAWRKRREKLVEYLRPMAQARKDHSKGFGATLRMVYQAMPVDWEKEIEQYKIRNHTTKRPQFKIDVIVDSVRLQRLFVETVKTLGK